MPFEDSSLDDPDALLRADTVLRGIASRGAHLRRAHTAAEEVLSQVSADGRPRAVVVITGGSGPGADAGPGAQVDAALAPLCPVPCVSAVTVPGWVGPMDVVVVPTTSGDDGESVVQLLAAVRHRGARAVVVGASARRGALADAAGPGAVVLTVDDAGEHDDPTGMVVTVLLLRALHRLGLASSTAPPSADDLADVADSAALTCARGVRWEDNPAKSLASQLADGLPLLHPGTELATPVAHRLVHALRTGLGTPAVVGTGAELEPLIDGAAPHSIFDDPVESVLPARPVVLLVDEPDTPESTAGRRRLVEVAAAHDVTVLSCGSSTASTGRSSPGSEAAPRGLAGWVDVALTAEFVAAYLRVGLDPLGR